jgi:hypothetical protein
MGGISEAGKKNGKVPKNILNNDHVTYAQNVA